VAKKTRAPVKKPKGPATAKQAKARSAKPAPTRATKPKRATKPSLPLPPPPPPAPPIRDELAAPRDVARLLRYGERFGAKKIDVRMLPLQLPVSSGMLAIGDASVPKAWKVLDRPIGPGTFRVMLSLARIGEQRDKPGSAPGEQLAALIIHVGRPPIARWTVAHAKGARPPRSPDQVPRSPVTTGWLALGDAGLVEGGKGPALAVGERVGVMPPVRTSRDRLAEGAVEDAWIEVALVDGRRALAVPSGPGEFAAYWGVDAQDKPVCLVIDFEAFTQKEWKAKP
jgi:hypothetical protein